MSTTIIDFWRANKAFWFPVSEEERRVADTAIQERFATYDYTQDNVFGQVIFLDQFLRHFDRTADLYEPRRKACALVQEHLSELDTADEVELVFSLMPFKHVGEYTFIFEFLHLRWLRGRAVSYFPLIARFYKDTYRKAFTQETVAGGLQFDHEDAPAFAPAEICEYYPMAFRDIDWSPSNVSESLTLDKHIEDMWSSIVSLSGGVDSMVMLALLARQQIPCVAVHIIYGNRASSQQEYGFVAAYCRRLGVPLIVYTIPWLRRSMIDREFYEEMTRELRFMVYKAAATVAGFPAKVLLGHIRDDVVENVWTNLAKGQHLGNLKKMVAVEEQMGVQICRPFLTVEKEEIYACSRNLAIPFLKNTTPSWSNRGKFRERFHAATVEQFGTGVDSKIVEVAEILESQHRLVERLLYEPILRSGTDAVYEITLAIAAEVDEMGWSTLLERMCHARGLRRPGIHAARDFMERLGRLNEDREMTIPLKRGVTVQVRRSMGRWVLRFL